MCLLNRSRTGTGRKNNQAVENLDIYETSSPAAPIALS
uniref:Uncharacterized protein n=1 Tax=Rhizophora mucronata TaxID=61149 RepID=A0A2P2N7F7_RHIMU